jgi:hypothetical protein
VASTSQESVTATAALRETVSDRLPQRAERLPHSGVDFRAVGSLDL